MKLERVQILRFVAAAAVVGYHAQGTLATYVPSAGRVGLSHGYLGVDLFFVISGFIIQLTSRARERDWRSFLYRRVARVVPLYWICTLGVFVLLHMPGFGRGVPASIGQLARSLGFVAWTAAPGALPVVYVGWSLEYEMFFYLCAAAALALFRASWPIVCGLFALLVAAGHLIGVDAAATPLYFFCNPVLLEFTYGVLIALAFEERRVPIVPVALVAGATLLLLVAPHDENAWRVWVAGVPSAALVAGAVRLDVVRPLRAGIGRLLAQLGDASYSIYLVHLTVVSAVCKLLVRLWPGAPEGLAILVIFVISVLFAELVYALVERPLQRLSHRSASRPAAGAT